MGWVPHANKSIATLYMHAHSMRDSNKIVLDDQTILEENFLEG